MLEKRSVKFSARPKTYYIVRRSPPPKLHRLPLQLTSQDTYIDPDKIYWGFHDQTPAFHIARKLTAGVMSSVRAGLTEPLQHVESLRSIQLLLSDGGKNWLAHIKRYVQSPWSV